MSIINRLTFSSVLLALTFLALVAAACGGDGDGGEIRIGSEEDYVKAACEAQNDFFVGFKFYFGPFQDTFSKPNFCVHCS